MLSSRPRNGQQVSSRWKRNSWVIGPGLALVLAVKMAAVGLQTEIGAQDPDPPWNESFPELTRAQIEAAKGLARHLRHLPAGGRPERARDLNWGWFWRNRPIGNLDRSTLRALLAGTVFIYRIHTAAAGRDPAPDHGIHYGVFTEDGWLWSCSDPWAGSYPIQPRLYRYSLARDLVGAATFVTHAADRGQGGRSQALQSTARSGEPVVGAIDWPGGDPPDFPDLLAGPVRSWPPGTGTTDPESRTFVTGRPIIYDPLSGTLSVHVARGGAWRWLSGPIRPDRNGILSDPCPGIPELPGPRHWAQVGQSDSVVTRSVSLNDRRHPGRDLPVLFDQDPDRPLTMGMYFSIYPPPGTQPRSRDVR
ncbi:MAG: hypothetical protein OXI81_11405 [Paracoccaceae bacterium]|nr:hypothetical protein [Paracoccaceae bacterium]